MPGLHAAPFVSKLNIVRNAASKDRDIGFKVAERTPTSSGILEIGWLEVGKAGVFFFYFMLTQRWGKLSVSPSNPKVHMWG